MNFKSIERETPGRDQVNQLHTPSKTGIPNQKSISSIRRGEIQTLAQYSTKLNQIRGEGSIYHKDHKTKLRPSSGILWAPQQATRSKSICRPGDRFVQVRPTQEREKPRHKPQQQMQETRLGKRRPKRPTSKATPKLPRPANSKSIP